MISIFSFFGWLADATIKGSVLIILIAITQRLIAPYVDAKWRHALWLIVLLRLAMPAAPASSFSIFNFLPQQAAIPVRTIAIESSPQPQLIPFHGLVMTELLAPRPWLGPWRWIAAVWILGALALALRALIATLRVHLAVRRELRHPMQNDVIDDAKRALGITREVRIIETPIVKAPALHGLFRPTLLLPPGLAASFTRDELRHVVLHELWHLRRFDVAVNWLLAAVQAVHWFNPFVWFAVSRIQEEREVACDELALSCLEEEERFGYGRTILKLLERFRAAAPVPALVGIVNHKQKMKRRLTMIASFKNRSRFSILFLALVAAVAGFGLTDASGGERLKLKKLDPAAAQTMDRLDQRLTFDLKNASLGELLNTVSNKTGVAVTQAPEVATSAAQQARFTLHVENVPAHAVLIETLMPFKLGPEPDANGVTIGRGVGCQMIVDEDVADDGVIGKKIERRIETDTNSNSTDKRVIVRATGSAECKLKADGSMHRELTLNFNENGVESQGKLVLDITK